MRAEREIPGRWDDFSETRRFVAEALGYQNQMRRSSGALSECDREQKTNSRASIAESTWLLREVSRHLRDPEIHGWVLR